MPLNIHIVHNTHTHMDFEKTLEQRHLDDIST